MQISEIGGEFKLIEQITKGFNKFNSNIYTGIGDDCAVTDLGDRFQLISADTLVNNDHFNLDWSTPEQVGMKVVEVNVSDIIACGGKPKAVLVSLVLTPEIEVETVQGIYDGIRKKCDKYKIDLLGGDTTHGKELVVNVTIMGEVMKITNEELRITNIQDCDNLEKSKGLDSRQAGKTESKGRETLLKLRSQAQEGDLICVTGDLGASTAGLEFLRKRDDVELLKKKYPYLYQRHLEPVASSYLWAGDLHGSELHNVHAMIDVSDGLASEVRHICEQSNCGAEVDFTKIPLHLETKLCAEELGQNAEDWALSGGEDFELVFTVAGTHSWADDLQGVSVVGRVLEKEQGIWLLKNGEREELRGGYNHFNSGMTN